MQDILPAHRCSFFPQWQRTAEEATQQAEDTSKSSAAYYNIHAHNLPDIHVESHVGVQNLQSWLWDIYGVVTEIGPYRRYYIKMTGSRVLVRNRCFLCRRVPTLVPKWLEPHTYTDSVTSETSQILRRSTWDKHPTRRLIEDPDWT